MESSRLRMIVGEIAIRPVVRSPRIDAIGASSVGGRANASPGSASRNPLTQATSGNSRITCRYAIRMPTSSTQMMSAFKPGLARNAVEIGDETAGLAYQQQPRSHVPGRKIAFPIAVEPSRGHPGEIERGRSESPQSADLALYRRDLVAELRKIAAPAMRQPAGHDRIVEPTARRHPQASIVHECAFAALGSVKLVGRRIVDEPGDDGAVARQRDRDRELRHAVQEIGGAVERIDDPAMGLVGARG